jgi:hypothetical protein
MKFMSSHISNCYKLYKIFKPVILSVIILVPTLASAQFERKVSVNLSGGLFKTFGPKEYEINENYNEDVYPYLMPNFQIGWLLNSGFQYNYNRHFSFELNLGISRSGYWYYDMYDAEYDHYYCWECWEICDEDTEETLASGEKYYTFFNTGIGITPKFYLLPSKKFNPYALFEFDINYTSIEFFDTEYDAYESLGRENEYGDSDSKMIMNNNFGVGIQAGIGVEYNLNDNLGFFAQTGYWLMFLKMEEFEEPKKQYENSHAFKFHLGVRLSFLKAKEL